jgi:spore germination cell wall hydrolase CwlJ-like protein
MKFKWLYYTSAMAANVAIGVFVWNTLTAAQPTPVAEVKSHHIVANIPTDVKELKCLADNIYFESLIEPLAGQIAVANVTMNRVNSPHFPNTVCEVVWANKQFSWTHDGKSDTPVAGKQYDDIYKLAKDVYTGKISDITEGSTFYHADYVNPSWAKKMDRKVVKIGRHIFYWNKDLS